VDEELPFRNEPQIDEEQIDLDESNDDNWPKRNNNKKSMNYGTFLPDKRQVI
jgi:hypothetical protein